MRSTAIPPVIQDESPRKKARADLERDLDPRLIIVGAPVAQIVDARAAGRIAI